MRKHARLFSLHFEKGLSERHFSVSYFPAFRAGPIAGVLTLQSWPHQAHSRSRCGNAIVLHLYISMGLTTPDAFALLHRGAALFCKMPQKKKKKQTPFWCDQGLHCLCERQRLLLAGRYNIKFLSGIKEQLQDNRTEVTVGDNMVNIEKMFSTTRSHSAHQSLQILTA